MRLNLRSFYYNFKKLPINQAVYLPLMISKNCCINSLKGKIIINGLVRSGMFQVGYGEVGVFDKRYSRSVLDIKGQLIINGKVRIGQGAKISIGKKGRLSLGEEFQISAESIIICHKEIFIGNGVLISWGVQIMDTDFHSIFKGSKKINEPAKIIIKDKVWIGLNSVILKGSIVNQNSVIAACSLMSKNGIETGNGIFGGAPIRLLKSDTNWAE
jgi:acetyltransferase-like isoleucine patch superfamily enzyme